MDDYLLEKNLLDVIAPLGEGTIEPVAEGRLLTTSSQQWAFSAALDLSMIKGPVTLQVDLKLLAGRLGIGWLGASGDWIDRTSTSSEAGPQSMRLPLRHADAPGRVVFDNWSEQQA